jgi:hypothetical protein
MHVLGLVFNIAFQVLRIPLRLTAAELLLEASYPINFVVKDPNLHVEGPALRRLKPAEPAYIASQPAS